jgi:hypothetical protein
MRNIKRVFLGKPITLEPKAVGKINFRQGLIFIVAAIICLNLIFFVETIWFPIRLTLAIFIGVGLITIAIVPFRGTTFERAIFEMVGEMIGNKQYLHQTAEPIEPDLPKPTREKPKTEDETKRRHGYVSGGGLALDYPNFGTLLFVFMCLVSLASFMLYASRGSVPGVTP